MTDFTTVANRISSLDEMANDELRSKLKSKAFKKGDYLLRKGQICRYIYFIDRGLAKTSFTTETKEFIMRFFPEQSVFTVLDSYFQQCPSQYDIVALEQTEVTVISKTEMDELCSRHHCMEKFLRKLVSLASMNMMNRISEMLEENATERYNHFLRAQGELLQRISLGDLASYLGINQVSLSRIRAKR